MIGVLGALRAPEDVFSARYVEFFDQIRQDRSSFGYGCLAKFVQRLNTLQFKVLDRRLQSALVEVSRDSGNPSAAIFLTLALIDQKPALVKYNQDTCWSIVQRGLIQVYEEFFVDNAPPERFYPAFGLYARLYPLDYLRICYTIKTVITKNPPYQQVPHQPQQPVLIDLPLWNKRGRDEKPQLVVFLLRLLGAVIRYSPKGMTIDPKTVIDALKSSFTLRNTAITLAALDIAIRIARQSGEEFAFCTMDFLRTIKVFDIPDAIVLPFLTDLSQYTGNLSRIVTVYKDLPLRFANVLKSRVKQKVLVQVPMDPPNRLKTIIEDSGKSYVSDGDSAITQKMFIKLFAVILENDPYSIAPDDYKMCLENFCRILVTERSANADDIRLLNAFLAVKHDNIPSPVQVARGLLPNYLAKRDPYLAPLLAVTQAFCELQRENASRAFPAASNDRVKSASPMLTPTPSIKNQSPVRQPSPAASSEDENTIQNIIKENHFPTPSDHNMIEDNQSASPFPTIKASENRENAEIPQIHELIDLSSDDEMEIDTNGLEDGELADICQSVPENTRNVEEPEEVVKNAAELESESEDVLKQIAQIMNSDPNEIVDVDVSNSPSIELSPVHAPPPTYQEEESSDDDIQFVGEFPVTPQTQISMQGNSKRRRTETPTSGKRRFTGESQKNATDRSSYVPPKAMYALDATSSALDDFLQDFVMDSAPARRAESASNESTPTKKERI